MATPAHTSAIAAPLPWYASLSSLLDRNHPFWQSRELYIGESVGLTLATYDQRPHRPPPGKYSFFVGQLEGGLRLPVPPAFLEISRFYGIALNQFAPNAFRILAGAVITFRHLGLSLTPPLFHCFFQLKMSDSGIFYFSARPECQFLKGMPSSHKGWKSLYFFATLPSPLPCAETWRLDLPDLPAVPDCRQECGFEAVARVLQDHCYNVNHLVEHHLLGFFGLSHFVPEEAILIGIFSPPPCFLNAVLTGILSFLDDLMQRAMVSALHLQVESGSKRKREESSSPTARRSSRKKKVDLLLAAPPQLSPERQLPQGGDSVPRDPSPGSPSSEEAPLIFRRHRIPPLLLPALEGSPPLPPSLQHAAPSSTREEGAPPSPTSVPSVYGNCTLDSLLSPPPETESFRQLALQALFTAGSVVCPRWLPSMEYWPTAFPHTDRLCAPAYLRGRRKRPS